MEALESKLALQLAKATFHDPPLPSGPKVAGNGDIWLLGSSVRLIKVGSEDHDSRAGSTN
jgi:hypothetical protein